MAAYFGRDISTVGSLLGRFEDEMQSDRVRLGNIKGPREIVESAKRLG